MNPRVRRSRPEVPQFPSELKDRSRRHNDSKRGFAP
jgi:hypothetical protein